MSNYFSSNTDVSSLITPGNTTFDNSYSGFPAGVNTTNNWENPTPLGYEISGVDISNSVKATYTDYTSDVTFTPPSWCKNIKIIAIAGGGGGGSGGGNANSRGGSGGSGAGGALATITNSNQIYLPGYIFNVTFGTGGAGGAYQGSGNSYGYWGQQGKSIAIQVTTNFSHPGQSQGNVVIYGGGGGGAGMKPGVSNNVSQGGQNTVVSPGNNTTTPTAGVYDTNFGLYISSSGGNAGSGGDNQYIGAAGIVQNYSGNSNPPTLNTNKDYTSINDNSTNGVNGQSNNHQINNTNEIPGYGQGGVGGINSNNGNGYPGQNGGSPLVRVYYMA